MSHPPNPTILIDFNNLAFRSLHAFKELSHEGISTGTYFGFFDTVLRLRESSKRLVFCLDHGLPNDKFKPAWRKKLWPEYKADRGEVYNTEEGQNLRIRFDQEAETIYRLLTQAMGYEAIGVPGMEADDLIAIRAAQTPGPVVIYTGDADLYQCITPDNRVIVRTKQAVITAAKVRKEFGIGVDQWASFLAMGGDKSDSIKPKKGMGPKTAIKLVLDGAKPWKPWKEQILSFTAKHRSLEEIWPRVQQCYFCAQLPTSWDDVRIASYRVPDTLFTPRVCPTGMKEFMTFCADHGLAKFIASRHQFFA